MTGMQTTRPRPQHSALAAYLRQINETPLLTAEEERELAWRVQEGDPAARDHLVRANLRLVVSLARHYQGRGVDLPDLIAEGNLGLLRAAEAFDPDMQTRFSTYAAYWVRQSLRRAVVNTGRTVRLPAYMAQLLSDWNRASAALREELGRVPEEPEIAARLGLTARKLRLIRKAIRIHNALPQGDEGDQANSLGALVPDVRAVAPDAALEQADELQQVLQFVDELDDRERAVLQLRFGLGGEEPKTLQEAGQRLNLTRERVRQIEQHALAALREKLLAS
jgi:RNA polymerase primary sigma factor